jgi:hypothetical protein
LTERWEQRLRELRADAPSDMWRRIEEGPRNAPSVGMASRRQRVVAAVVALALFAVAGVFAWRALGPSPAAIGSSAPSPSGFRVYTDPLGWTADYPASWHVFTTARTSDGLGAMVTFEDPAAVREQGPTQNDVFLRIAHAIDATPHRSAGSSAFPLSVGGFKVVPGPGDLSALNFKVAGVRFFATVHIGSSASKADIAAVDHLIASIRPSGSTSAGAADPVADRILNAIDSSRVTGLETKGSTAVVTGEASTSQGDVARTDWYETFAGAAYAQTNSLGNVERIVQDASGSTLEDETDPATRSKHDPFEPLSLSADDIRSSAEQAAQRLGATVTEVHYIALYGGTAEIVVQPDDPTAFVASACTNELLGGLGQDSQPYLLTVVDSSGDPQLVLGFVPGLGGSNGQGMAWVAPGLKSCAVSQPITIPSVGG